MVPPQLQRVSWLFTIKIDTGCLRRNRHMIYRFIFNQTFIILKLIVFPIKLQFMSVDKFQLVIPLLFFRRQYPLSIPFYYSVWHGYRFESPWFLHFNSIDIKNFDDALNIYPWSKIVKIICCIYYSVFDIRVFICLYIFSKYISSVLLKI